MKHKFGQVNKLIVVLIYILLFMFSVSIFNLAGYILPVLLLFYGVTKPNSKIVVSRSLIILFVFSVIYFVDYSLFWQITVRDVILYLIAPWGSYLFALNFIKESQDDHRLGKMVLILVSGLFAHGILNLYAFYSTYGFDYAFRITVDFWRNEVISVTGCSLYYVPAMSISLGYLFFGEKRFIKAVSVLTLAVGILANVVYSNRTAVYLLSILLFVAIVTKMKQNLTSVRGWVVFLAVAAVMFSITAFDLFGIRTAIDGLEIVQRIKSNEVGRVEVWTSFLSSDWFLYPFGGDQVDFGFNFAHNLWLDIIRTVGILPFIALCVFTIQSSAIIKKFSAVKSNYTYYVYLVAGMAISCFVEPIMEANPYYFITLVMIIGGMEGYLVRTQNG